MRLTASAALAALALAAPAFAGGDHCRSKASASAANVDASCSSKNTSAAWAGAWLQRSSTGQIVVADVAKGSPAAKAGMRTGDVVLAVNGYDLADEKASAMCASRAECNVGSNVAYTVQRGASKKSFKVKLEKMPADAASRLASGKAKFDPMLAAVVYPAVQ